MKTTPEQIVDVAKEHVRMYENRVEAARQGRRGINLDECAHYLRVWQSIANKGGQNLSLEELREVQDAYDCGEYDHIFKREN